MSIEHFDRTHEYMFDKIMCDRGYHREDNPKIPETNVYRNSDNHIIRINRASGYVYSHYKGDSMSVCPGPNTHQSWMIPGTRRHPYWAEGTPFVSKKIDDVSLLSVLTVCEMKRLRWRDFKRKIRHQMKDLLKCEDFEAIRKLRKETGIGLTPRDSDWLERGSTREIQKQGRHRGAKLSEWSGLKWTGICYAKKILEEKLYHPGYKQLFLRDFINIPKYAKQITARNVNFRALEKDKEIFDIFAARYPDLGSYFSKWCEVHLSNVDELKNVKQWLKLHSRRRKLKQIGEHHENTPRSQRV